MYEVMILRPDRSGTVVEVSSADAASTLVDKLNDWFEFDGLGCRALCRYVNSLDSLDTYNRAFSYYAIDDELANKFAMFVVRHCVRDGRMRIPMHCCWDMFQDWMRANASR